MRLTHSLRPATGSSPPQCRWRSRRRHRHSPDQRQSPGQSPFGIDWPEKAQDFGTKVKQFTLSIVFGKMVQVEAIDQDRYGRTVGLLTVDGMNVNEAILGWTHLGLHDLLPESLLPRLAGYPGCRPKGPHRPLEPSGPHSPRSPGCWELSWQHKLPCLS